MAASSTERRLRSVAGHLRRVEEPPAAREGQSGVEVARCGQEVEAVQRRVQRRGLEDQAVAMQRRAVRGGPAVLVGASIMDVQVQALGWWWSNTPGTEMSLRGIPPPGSSYYGDPAATHKPP